MSSNLQLAKELNKTAKALETKSAQLIKKEEAVLEGGKKKCGKKCGKKPAAKKSVAKKTGKKSSAKKTSKK